VRGARFFGGTSQRRLTPCSTISGMPDMRVEMTGKLHRHRLNQHVSGVHVRAPPALGRYARQYEQVGAFRIGASRPENDQRARKGPRTPAMPTASRAPTIPHDTLLV